MIRHADKHHGFLIRSTISGVVLGTALVFGLPALAGEGGAPQHRGSIFQIEEAAELGRVRATRMPSKDDATVIEAGASTKDERRWHDKTEAEWRAYHEQKGARYRQNFGR